MLGFLLVVRQSWRTVDFAIHACRVHSLCRYHAGDSDNRLWFCSVRAAGVAAAGAARLPQHVCKTWDRCILALGIVLVRPTLADARTHALY